MQRSLKNFWSRSQSRDKPEALASSATLPLIGHEPFVQSDGLDGILLELTPNLLIERKSLFSLLLAALIYICAAFMANEWLYLLASGLVMAVFWGIVIPTLSTRCLVADCFMPPSAVANESSEIAVSISMHNWLKHLQWLLPIDCLRTRILLARRSYSGYVVEQTLSKQPILLEHVNNRAVLKLQVPLFERGVYKLSSIEVGTPFPFGMAWAIRDLQPSNTLEESIVVYPRSHALNGSFLTELAGQISSMGLSFTETLALTQSTSVRSIRDFREGDSLRHIHWPSTARLGKMLVREFDSETLPVFDIYFDLCANWKNRQQFELAVTLVTALIDFGYDHDILPELFLAPEIDSAEIAVLMSDLPSGNAPLDHLMEIMARIEPLPPRTVSIKTSPTSKHQLLAVLPQQDAILRGGASSNAPEHPIQLVALQRKPNREIDVHNHTVIATIYGEQDLQAL